LTASFYVKMADNSSPRVSVGDGGANFDMAINIANNPAGVSNITITLVQGAVYRITGTLTTGGSVTQNHGIIQYADMSGKSFQVSQFQIEAGAFATSPIPTSGGTATRAADVISLAGAAATAALAAKAAYFETSGLNLGSGVMALFTPASAQFIDFNTTSNARISNGTNTGQRAFGSGTVSGTVKAAFGFDATSMTAKVNSSVTTTQANSWSTVTGPIYIGSYGSGASSINGYMRRIAFSPTKGQFDGLTT
jgi:hypothetical protein